MKASYSLRYTGPLASGTLVTNGREIPFVRGEEVKGVPAEITIELCGRKVWEAVNDEDAQEISDEITRREDEAAEKAKQPKE